MASVDTIDISKAESLNETILVGHPTNLTRKIGDYV
jgi:hypothetical protein